MHMNVTEEGLKAASHRAGPGWRFSQFEMKEKEEVGAPGGVTNE